MSTLTAATWVAALLLMFAGVRKGLRPESAGAALRTTRLPSHVGVVRVLGLGEVTVGFAVLAVGGAVPVLAQAIAYGAFAVFAQRQRRNGSDCGCFGKTGTPVTTVHVWVNALFAGTGLAAAVLSVPTLTTMVARQPVAAATTAVLVVAATNLVRLLLTAAPELTAGIARLEPDGTA